jgi:hypothetical protein
MKIIDQTPFYNKETGEISILDRGKALIKFGPTWIKEVEGQKQIITVLEKVLDNSYTLLRNVVIPQFETSFPFILIGPPGVYVMYVTPLIGLFRARGDQWGSISGNTFKIEKPNLLTRTERMARVILAYLRRQGFPNLPGVDGILLCSNPSVNVDTIRPIIRVVMCDALERFAISLTQSRVVLDRETSRDIIAQILNPPKPVTAQPIGSHPVASSNPPQPSISLDEPVAPHPLENTPAVGPFTTQQSESSLVSEPVTPPLFESIPAAGPVEPQQHESMPAAAPVEPQQHEFMPDASPLEPHQVETIPVAGLLESQQMSNPPVTEQIAPVFAGVDDSSSPVLAFSEQQAPATTFETTTQINPEQQNPSRAPSSNGLNKKQWIFLSIMVVLLCLLITIFLFLVLGDQKSFLLSLLP